MIRRGRAQYPPAAGKRSSFSQPSPTISTWCWICAASVVEAALQNLKRTENEARVVKEYDDIYEGLLFPAFLLLVGEACMSDRRRSPRRAPTPSAQEKASP